MRALHCATVSVESAQAGAPLLVSRFFQRFSLPFPLCTQTAPPPISTTIPTTLPSNGLALQPLANRHSSSSTNCCGCHAAAPSTSAGHACAHHSEGTAKRHGEAQVRGNWTRAPPHNTARRWGPRNWLSKAVGAQPMRGGNPAPCYLRPIECQGQDFHQG